MYADKRIGNNYSDSDSTDKMESTVKFRIFAEIFLNSFKIFHELSPPSGALGKSYET